jgi:hypothetical protein
MVLDIVILSETKVLPSSPPKSLTQVPLSIIDATVANFSPSETVLLFDDAISPFKLQTALEKTLDAYPQWCGTLSRNHHNPEAISSTERYGRLKLTYGRPEDPGVVFLFATANQSLSSLVPSREERINTKIHAAWDASAFPSSRFSPKIPLSTSNFEDPSLPSLVIQVTTFLGGGMAVALKFAHPLTDAHGMSLFVQGWAAACRATTIETDLPTMKPIFEPQMLDRCAAGDINAPHADPKLIAQANALSCHRYDWWISREGCSFPKSTEIPDELKNTVHDAPGTKLEWSEWDLTAPVLHYVLHFTGLEIEAMWKAASKLATAVSRQDALLAHVSSCIYRARLLTEDDDPVYIDYTLGLRSRVSPKLLQSFVGSPLMIAAISASGRDASATDSAALALNIRSTVAKFTPENVAAHLHAKLYEQSPQRLWQTFLGKRHLLVTSWIHTRMYDIDFGCGSPRYVEAVMPQIDGLVQLMEAAPIDRNEGKHWAADGVDVQLHLTTETMLRLLDDPLLRKYSA